MQPHTPSFQNDKTAVPTVQDNARQRCHAFAAKFQPARNTTAAEILS